MESYLDPVITTRQYICPHTHTGHHREARVYAKGREAESAGAEGHALMLRGIWHENKGLRVVTQV